MGSVWSGELVLSLRKNTVPNKSSHIISVIHFSKFSKST